MAVETEVFLDRPAAGRLLAARLRGRPWHEPVVLGLARGGVPVAAQVAGELGVPLDVAVARKIGVPGQPEFGVGAVTADGPPYYAERTLTMLGLDARDLSRACADEREEARRRVRRYQGDRPPTPTRGRDVLVIDDGLATGVTATAALRALRRTDPRRLVFAAPACAPDAAQALTAEADEVVCLSLPSSFVAVGQWYQDFGQTTDDEVIALLTAGAEERP
ncbi:putative phosphoribosyltransferase [Actinoalloteichus hoggarensis]|uniref:Putative phosphoribosyl transferase n=1 Tax=Actinoalloteichus hoggarensis TaxID=1470176 RepID=A0A221W4T2_9PSEU|nr:phosphoribosyltransferase family protein [Actinoalloteichus hoggarensis]ASO20892.1 Putative phosphoribosyl transferase [Actinoalloteichus hoggarensis]MBB5920823.1 putative phosphoribosyltransferase [Actinoalloteichus hoggarensis]